MPWVLFNNINGIIWTATINNYIFKIGIILIKNRKDRLFNKLPLVEGRSDYGNFRSRNVAIFYLLIVFSKNYFMTISLKMVELGSSLKYLFCICSLKLITYQPKYFPNRCMHTGRKKKLFLRNRRFRKQCHANLKIPGNLFANTSCSFAKNAWKIVE